jgi:hypothetical protein
MISFSRVPYADAVARAARQDRVLKAVPLALVVAVSSLTGGSDLTNYPQISPIPQMVS